MATFPMEPNEQHISTETGELNPGTPADFFSTEHLKADLKGRSVRGGAVTVAAQAVRFCLRMVSTVVLARLLTPQDFGLIAMVTAVVAFVEMFKDMGLSMATVQRDKIDNAQISTLFWINVVLSIALMLVLVAMAPIIAWFYGEPRLIWITLALAGTFIFVGLTVQHRALLRRHMRFGSLALIQIISMTAGIVTAIIAAWYGAGYWALVLMELAIAITVAIGVWIAMPWRPGLPSRGSGVRTMLAFGGNLTGFKFLNYFARNLDNILIGWYWGAASLGLYSKAYSLLMLPIQQIRNPINAVATPALSRLQDDPEQYSRYYYRAVNMIAFLSMPIVAVMAGLSDEIIGIVLGRQWIGTADIFKILALAAALQPVLGTTGWIFVSLGQAKRMMYWGLIAVPVTVLSFIIGLPWGPIGVAASYTVCGVFILLFPSLLFAFKYSPVNLTGFFKAIWCPLTISLVMYISLEVCRRYLAFSSLIETVVYCSICAVLVTLLFLILWRRARDEVFDALKIVRLLKTPKPVV